MAAAVNNTNQVSCSTNHDLSVSFYFVNTSENITNSKFDELTQSDAKCKRCAQEQLASLKEDLAKIPIERRAKILKRLKLLVVDRSNDNETKKFAGNLLALDPISHALIERGLTSDYLSQ